MRRAATERFWRRPLDADAIGRPRGVLHILEERCKGCMYCVEFCPCDVLVESERFNRKGYHPPDIALPDACVACGLCEIFCPEFAIRVEEQPASGPRPGQVAAEAEAGEGGGCPCTLTRSAS